MIFFSSVVRTGGRVGRAVVTLFFWVVTTLAAVVRFFRLIGVVMFCGVVTICSVVRFFSVGITIGIVVTISSSVASFVVGPEVRLL